MGFKRKNLKIGDLIIEGKNKGKFALHLVIIHNESETKTKTLYSNLGYGCLIEVWNNPIFVSDWECLKAK